MQSGDRSMAAPREHGAPLRLASSRRSSARAGFILAGTVSVLCLLVFAQQQHDRSSVLGRSGALRASTNVEMLKEAAQQQQQQQQQSDTDIADWIVSKVPSAPALRVKALKELKKEKKLLQKELGLVMSHLKRLGGSAKPINAATVPDNNPFIIKVATKLLQWQHKNWPNMATLKEEAAVLEQQIAAVNAAFLTAKAAAQKAKAAAAAKAAAVPAPPPRAAVPLNSMDDDATMAACTRPRIGRARSTEGGKSCAGEFAQFALAFSRSDFCRETTLASICGTDSTLWPPGAKAKGYAASTTFAQLCPVTCRVAQSTSVPAPVPVAPVPVAPVPAASVAASAPPTTLPTTKPPTTLPTAPPPPPPTAAAAAPAAPAAAAAAAAAAAPQPGPTLQSSTARLSAAAPGEGGHLDKSFLKTVLTAVDETGESEDHDELTQINFLKHDIKMLKAEVSSTTKELVREETAEAHHQASDNAIFQKVVSVLNQRR